MKYIRWDRYVFNKQIKVGSLVKKLPSLVGYFIIGGDDTNIRHSQTYLEHAWRHHLGARIDAFKKTRLFFEQVLVTGPANKDHSNRDIFTGIVLQPVG